MRTITMTRVEGFIMNKSVKMLVNCVADPYLFGVLVDFGASWITREEPLETCSTIAIVRTGPTSCVRPCDTIGAPPSSPMCYALVATSLSSLVAPWFVAPSSAPMCCTLVRAPYCNLVAAWIVAPLSAPMCCTLVGAPYSNLVAPWFVASATTSMCCTFVRAPPNILVASWFLASISTPMCYTLVAAPLSTFAAPWFLTPLPCHYFYEHSVAMTFIFCSTTKIQIVFLPTYVRIYNYHDGWNEDQQYDKDENK